MNNARFRVIVGGCRCCNMWEADVRILSDGPASERKAAEIAKLEAMIAVAAIEECNSSASSNINAASQDPVALAEAAQVATETADAQIAADEEAVRIAAEKEVARIAAEKAEVAGGRLRRLQLGGRCSRHWASH